MHREKYFSNEILLNYFSQTAGEDQLAGDTPVHQCFFAEYYRNYILFICFNLAKQR